MKWQISRNLAFKNLFTRDSSALAEIFAFPQGFAFPQFTNKFEW